MKDIHSHILYGIDDGADSIEESLRLIKKAYDNGYTDLILTPHFRKIHGFTCNNQVKNYVFNHLKEEIQKNNIPINIYLGNEIALDEDLFYYLETEMVTTINNGKYLLLELPFKSKFNKLNEYIEDLQSKGYKVIIAHPERYHYYKDLKIFEELINMGVLMQGNFESLNGKWGKTAKQKLTTMLKRHMIHFLGSDIHHSEENSYRDLHQLIPLLKELTMDDKMVKDLTDNNILKVINNEDIKPYKIICKENLWHKLFNRK